MDEHSPITRYSKTFFNGYMYASLIGMLAVSFGKETNTALNQSLTRTHADYTKVNRLETFKLLYRRARPFAIAFAGFATVFRYIGDKLV